MNKNDLNMVFKLITLK